MKPVFLAAILFIWATGNFLAGQTPPAAAPSSVDSIIQLVKSGVSEGLIIRTLQRANVPADLTPGDLVKLKNAGVSDNIVSVMLDPGNSSAPSAPGGRGAAPASAVATVNTVPAPAGGAVAGTPVPPAAAAPGVTPAAGRSSGAPVAVAPAPAEVLPAGTVVAIRMIDTVDSDRDSAGRVYRAVVSKALTEGNVTVARGAAATVALEKVQSAYSVHLTSLAVGGKVTALTSDPGNLSGTAENAAATASNTVGSVFGVLGKKSGAGATMAAVSSGTRVVLPSGAELLFAVSKAPAPATGAVPGKAAAAAPGVVPTGTSAVAPVKSAAAAPIPVTPATAVPAAVAQPVTPARSGYCFSAANQPAVYFSASFETAAVTAPQAWNLAFTQFLAQTYSYKGAVVCRVATQAAVQTTVPALVAQYQRLRKTVVQTGWKAAN